MWVCSNKFRKKRNLALPVSRSCAVFQPLWEIPIAYGITEGRLFAFWILLSKSSFLSSFQLKKVQKHCLRLMVCINVTLPYIAKIAFIYNLHFHKWKLYIFYIDRFIPFKFSRIYRTFTQWHLKLCRQVKKFKYKNVFINQTVVEALPHLNIFISYKKYLPSRDNTAALL